MTFKSEARWLVLIALIVFALFANSLNGDFVYDDKRQIAGNALIQTPALYGKALSNDVWAFKGDGSISASNYWRPTFTAWCILNFTLFALDPWGWHFLNLLLHAGVCIFAFLLLRKWGISQFPALALTLIFAVHPVHTEAVAWVSGAPDLLFGLFFLGSLWFAEMAADRDKKKRRAMNMVLAVSFYVLALGAKEVAFLCFPIYYLIFARNSGQDSSKGNKNKAWVNRFGVFAVAAAAYFVVRWMLLGQLSRPAEGAAGTLSAVLSAPSIFVFYLRQLVFPYWVGVNYPLRPVSEIGFMNFIVPLVISVAAVAALWWVAKRSSVGKMGLALFALPLLTVFNVGAFLPEQIVHDRYLYLSLLGFLIVLFTGLHELFEKVFTERAERLLLVFAVLACVPLAIQTFQYNRVWANELSLWTHAVKIDPASASNWSALGSELSERDQPDEAIRAYDHSLGIRPAPIAYIGRAQNLIKKGKVDEGIVDLQAVTAINLENIDIYTLYQAYEGLALAYEQKNALDKAEAVLTEGRQRLPIYKAALTEKLAVILYLQNRKPEALKELESMKGPARVEMLPASKSVFLRLGMLYAEMGKKNEARASLGEYLALTATTWDKETPAERKQAEELLRQLK